MRRETLVGCHPLPTADDPSANGPRHQGHVLPPMQKAQSRSGCRGGRWVFLPGRPCPTGISGWSCSSFLRRWVSHSRSRLHIPMYGTQRRKQASLLASFLGARKALPEAPEQTHWPELGPRTLPNSYPVVCSNVHVVDVEKSGAKTSTLGHACRPWRVPGAGEGVWEGDLTGPRSTQERREVQGGQWKQRSEPQPTA